MTTTTTESTTKTFAQAAMTVTTSGAPETPKNTSEIAPVRSAHDSTMKTKVVLPAPKQDTIMNPHDKESSTTRRGGNQGVATEPVITEGVRYTEGDGDEEVVYPKDSNHASDVAPNRRTETVPSAEHNPNARPGTTHNGGNTIYETGDALADPTLQIRNPVGDSVPSKPLVPWFGSGNATGSGLLGSLEDHPTSLEEENVLSTHASVGRADNATPDPLEAHSSTNSAGNPFGSAFSDLLGSARPSATGIPSFNQNLPPPGSFFAQSWNSGSPPVSHKGSGSPPGSLKSIGSVELNGSGGAAPIGSERERRSANRTSVTFAPTPPLTPPADEAPVQIQSMQIKRSEPLRFFDPDATATAQQVQDHGQQFSSMQYSPIQQHFQPNHLQSPTQQQYLQPVARQQMNASPNQQQQAFQVEVQQRAEMERMEKARLMGAQEMQQKQLEAAQKEAKQEFERAQREQFQQAMALFGFTGVEMPASMGAPNPSQSGSPPPIPQVRGYRPSTAIMQNGPGMNYFNQQQPQTNAYGFVPQTHSGFGSVTATVGRESVNLLAHAARDRGIVHTHPTHSGHSMMGSGPTMPPVTSHLPVAHNGGASPDLPHHLSHQPGQFMHPSPTHRPSGSLPAAQSQQALNAHHTPSPSLQVQMRAEPPTKSQSTAPPATHVAIPQIQRVSTPISHPASAKMPVSVGPIPLNPASAPAPNQEIVVSPVAMNQTAASFLLRALDTNPFDIEFVFYRRAEGGEDVKTKGMLASSAWLRGKSEWLDGILENAFPDGNVIGWDYTQDNDKADGEGKGPAPVNPEKAKDGAPKKIVLRDVAYRTWKSFLAYLYTEKLTFEPASALSMYRVAERAGIPRLRMMALKMLERYLYDCPGEMVVEMAFEVFSTRYEEVLDVEVAVIKYRLREGPISGEGVKRKLQEKIGAAMGGELGHAELAVRKLVMAVF